MTQSPGLLILGNGAAAIHAVTASRKAGHTGPIHMVSDTSGSAFNPMLAPYFLAGKIHFKNCFPFGEDFYNRHRVTCHFGSPVATLNAANKEVLLESGERLSYDRCLVATGSRPTLPNIPGLNDFSRVFTLRTPKDTIALHQALSPAKHALVLGASMIGVKLAEILMGHGIKVTLLDVADQIMPNAAHPECAPLMEFEIKKRGVNLHLGRTLEGVEKRGRNLFCHFKDSRSLEADLCLVCTGVRPNLDFLDPDQVKMDQGILIDDHMKTSAEGLYAAGDISQGFNPATGAKEMIGLWGNACWQGNAAGRNMAGSDTVYPGTIPHHISLFFGLAFVHLGDINRSGTDVTVLSNNRFSGAPFYLLVFDNGTLVGVNAINAFQHAGRLKSAILQKLDWSKYLDFRMANPTDGQIERILMSFRTA